MNAEPASANCGTWATGATTTYFRRSFNFSGDPAHTALTLTSLVDDGAAFYLNGIEIARQNLPLGVLAHGTLSSSVVGMAAVGEAIVLPSTGLLQGTNVLAVELHQAATGDPDATFGMTLTARETVVPPTPERTLDTEFVEVFNRSAAGIDLSGWSLDGDAGFTFPAGTTLAAGGFLAVARNPVALQPLHPGAPIIGPLDGGLRNSGGRVLLRDPSGNPADTVAWADGAPWPDAPDGGGPTLERRDFVAASNAPEAWVASDESGRTAWQTYSYRGVAGPSAIGPDAQWREFLVGLLDAGEVLLDDVSVVEDPDGTPVQMLPNTNFSAGIAGWRVLGNHTGTIIADPGQPGNQVLRLVAGGSTDHDGNLAETTLAAGRSIVNGRTYEISFRARWISGSPSLNTRLYFNRLPRTTRLAVPEAAGTPGAPNSRGFANIGPTFSGLRHSPAVPAVGAPVTVSVRLADPDGVGAVTLRYAVNAGAWQALPMNASGGTFAATIPGQAASAIVQFYAEATDGLGVTATAPAAGPASRALYKVEDGLANLAAIHNIRLVMTAADANAMHANTNLMSGGEHGATVITDEGEACYDAGVHLRGSRYGRPYDQFISYSVRFPADRLFRGVHQRIVIDRSGRGPFGSPSPDEILVKHMAGHAAGGLAALHNDIVHVITPLPQHTSVALLTTDYSNDWLDRHFDDGSDSPLYKLDGIYYPTRTTDGNAESPKVVEAGPIVWADIANHGTDPENYRWNFIPENAAVQPGAERLMALCAAFDLSGPALDAASRAVMDVDQWARTFALQSLIGNGDFYTHVGQPHNLKLYLRPGDGRFLAFQHDSDVCFNRPTDASLIGTTGNLVKVFNLPANRRLFHGHLRDIINTTFNRPYMDPWIAHYGAKAGKDFTAAQTYITARRAYVLSQLPAAVPFAITTNGGANFTVNSTQVALDGSGWIDVREIRRADTGAVLDTEWTGENTWRISLALLNGANAITLRAFDHQGTQVGTDTITITSTLNAPLPRDFLRITELHYHPTPPVGAELNVSTDKDDFEFIELRNLGAQTLDISGCAFTAGVDFIFPSNTTLAAGETILVVRHVAAFQTRYGSAQRLAGAYGPADSLSNSGETVTLVDATGAVIQSFTYDDALPWPANADGAGYSLISIAPQLALNGSLASSWRASVAVGGNPGASDAATFVGNPNADADFDGLTAFLEYALGTSDTQPNTNMLLLLPEAGGTLAVTFTQRLAADDITLTLETSPNLAAFAPASATLLASSQGGALLTQTWRLTPPAGSSTFFVRLKASSR